MQNSVIFRLKLSKNRLKNGLKIASLFMSIGLQTSIFANTTATNQQQTVQQNCQTLSKQMQAVNDTTLLAVIHEINKKLKVCVKNFDNKQLLIWFQQHVKMYDNFTNAPNADVEQELSDNGLYGLSLAYWGSLDVNGGRV